MHNVESSCCLSGAGSLICSYDSSYYGVVEFEWDEAKRQSNLAKHRVDFAIVRRLFDGRAIVTTRSSHPAEARYVTTGVIEDLYVTVIWTQRDTAIRFISARRSRDAERRIYRSIHGR